MTKIRKSTKVLAIVATILVIVLGALMFMAFREDAYAEDEFIPAEDNVVIESEEPPADGGNWLAENWKTVVEILTSGTALAVVLAIIKFIGKVAKLRKDLGDTNTDNTAIKSAFNDMVDEIEDLKTKLKDVHTQCFEMWNSVADSGKKSSAVLNILERLISSSDLPAETKVALQGVINKADEKEKNADDEE